MSAAHAYDVIREEFNQSGASVHMIRALSQSERGMVSTNQGLVLSVLIRLGLANYKCGAFGVHESGENRVIS